MSAGPEVSTDRELPLEWWHVVAAGAVVWALLAAVSGFEGVLGPRVYDSIGLLALLVWAVVPVAMYLDVRSIREAGVPWGSTWYLYYSSAVFPGPAVYYLLRRLTKMNRVRRRGLLDQGDDESGGDGSDADAIPAADAGGSEAATGVTQEGVRDAGGEDAGFEWGGRSEG